MRRGKRVIKSALLFFFHVEKQVLLSTNLLHEGHRVEDPFGGAELVLVGESDPHHPVERALGLGTQRYRVGGREQPWRHRRVARKHDLVMPQLI